MPELIPPPPAADLTLVPGNLPVASPLDLPAGLFQAALERRKHNRQVLLDWLRDALAPGVDCGRIHSVGKNRCKFAAQGLAHECPDPHHWSRLSLWKPGAEKICGMLGVTVHYPTLPAYEQAALQGLEFKTILLRCELHDATGRVVAEGIGARSVAQDGGDLNKALKMAEKSAMIDATLRFAGLSEVFTQDLGDSDGEASPAPVPVTPTPPEPPAAEPSDLVRDLDAHLQRFTLEPARVLAWCRRRWGTASFADLTPAHYQELRSRLPDFARQRAAERAAADAATTVTAPEPASPPAVDPTAGPLIPAALRQQLEQQARLKGVPAPVVTTPEQARAELRRLFQLPPAASAAA